VRRFNAKHFTIASGTVVLFVAHKNVTEKRGTGKMRLKQKKINRNDGGAEAGMSTYPTKSGHFDGS
jgi:hypothetical protein